MFSLSDGCPGLIGVFVGLLVTGNAFGVIALTTDLTASFCTFEELEIEPRIDPAGVFHTIDAAKTTDRRQRG